MSWCHSLFEVGRFLELYIRPTVFWAENFTEKSLHYRRETMVSKFYAMPLELILVFAILGCSASQSKTDSSYTSLEIEYYKQFQTHITDMMSHVRNFDTISKNAKPPYDDPVLKGKLLDELEQAAHEAQIIADLDCPTSRFKSLCTDFAKMKDVVAMLFSDMEQYYASGFGNDERQRIIVDQNTLSTLAKSIAEESAQLEAQYGKMK
jgi:hypothetical protein